MKLVVLQHESIESKICANPKLSQSVSNNRFLVFNFVSEIVCVHLCNVPVFSRHSCVAASTWIEWTLIIWGGFVLGEQLKNKWKWNLSTFLFLSVFTDDSFVTPPSTPPLDEDEEFMSIVDSTNALVNEMSSETLIDMMYERWARDSFQGFVKILVALEIIHAILVMAIQWMIEEGL